MITLQINGKPVDLEVTEDVPLLWVLRDVAHLMGTKFGCAMGLCGACTVHVDGVATRSCLLPAAAAVGKQVTTIEHIANTPVGKATQAAWLAREVAQCGYCQSGQIMSATALLTQNRHPDDSQIDEAMAGNICRCGTYQRIREAIKEAAKSPLGAGS